MYTSRSTYIYVFLAFHRLTARGCGGSELVADNEFEDYISQFEHPDRSINMYKFEKYVLQAIHTCRCRSQPLHLHSFAPLLSLELGMHAMVHFAAEHGATWQSLQIAGNHAHHVRLQ